MTVYLFDSSGDWIAFRTSKVAVSGCKRFGTGWPGSPHRPGQTSSRPIDALGSLARG